jgi:hypothetical protein
VAVIESPAQEARCTERRKGHARVQIGGRVPRPCGTAPSHGLRSCALKRSRVEALKAPRQGHTLESGGQPVPLANDERRVHPFVVRDGAGGGDA